MSGYPDQALVGVYLDLRAAHFARVTKPIQPDLHADRPACQILAGGVDVDAGHSHCCHVLNCSFRFELEGGTRGSDELLLNPLCSGSGKDVEPAKRLQRLFARINPSALAEDKAMATPLVELFDHTTANAPSHHHAHDFPLL